MSTKNRRPIATRDGRILLPSVWSVLATQVIEAADTAAAFELARQVLAAAEHVAAAEAVPA